MPPAQVMGCAKALHQNDKGSLKMQMTPGGSAANLGLTDPNIPTPTSQMHHHTLSPFQELPGCPGLRRRILEVFISSKKNKYIKPPCSTSAETFHMGEETGANDNKRQLITSIGWGHSTMLISCTTKALPSECQPPEQPQGALLRSCCRYQQL